MEAKARSQRRVARVNADVMRIEHLDRALAFAARHTPGMGGAISHA